ARRFSLRFNHRLGPSLRGTSQHVEIRGSKPQTHEFQIEEELVFMVDQMFEVSEKNRQQRLSFRNEDGLYPAAQVRVCAALESTVDVLCVELDFSCRFIWATELVHRNRAKLIEGAELPGKCRAQRCAEPSKTIEQVPQEVTEVVALQSAVR